MVTLIVSPCHRTLTRIGSALLLLLARVASQQCMYTIAGGNGEGFSGDGLAATLANLRSPIGVARYGGGLLIADTGNHAVRRMDMASGLITTVAGSGSPGDADGVVATGDTLRNPCGVAAYGDGFVIADSANSDIRFVRSDKIITILAGRGNDPGGDGKPATNAMLSAPCAVATDVTFVYFAEEGTFRVRRVDSNRIITTIAGTGTIGYSGDGGPARDATVGSVLGIALFAGGLYLSDLSNSVVRRVDQGGVITTVAGGGSAPGVGMATDVALQKPLGIDVLEVGGEVYTFSDSATHLLNQVDAGGKLSVVAGSTMGYSGDGGPAGEAKLAVPSGLTVDDQKGIIFVDQGNHAIRYVTPSGMCAPRVDCIVSVPNLLCTFSEVAPFLFLNVMFSGAPCTMREAAPAPVRSAQCALPNATAATLFWTAGNVRRNLVVQIVSPTPSPSATPSRSSSVASSATASSTVTMSSTLSPVPSSVMTSSPSSSSSRTASATAFPVTSSVSATVTVSSTLSPVPSSVMTRSPSSSSSRTVSATAVVTTSSVSVIVTPSLASSKATSLSAATLAAVASIGSLNTSVAVPSASIAVATTPAASAVLFMSSGNSSTRLGASTGASISGDEALGANSSAMGSSPEAAILIGAGSMNTSIIIIATSCFVGSLCLICCCFMCWRARKRFESIRSRWSQDRTMFAMETAGTSSVHSAAVQRLSTVIVDAVMPVLQSSHPSDSAASEDAQLTLVRNAVRARFDQILDAPPLCVLEACADAAADAALTHSDVTNALSLPVGQQVNPATQRSLRTSVMIAVSHALEVAEKEQLLVSNAAAVSAQQSLQRSLVIAEQRLDDAAASLQSAQTLTSAPVDVGVQAVADQITSALCMQNGDDANDTPDDFLELIECIIEAGGNDDAACGVNVILPTAAEPSTALATEVVSEHASSAIHKVVLGERASAARSRAEVLRACVAEQLTRATALAPLPQPVVANLLTFAVKATVQQLTVQEHDDGLSRKERVELVLRHALAVALQELSKEDVIHCEVDASGSACTHLAGVTAAAAATSRATSHSNVMIGATHSAVKLNATANAMRAKAARACVEAKWVVAPPAPLPSFTACVIAEVLSWLRPSRPIVDRSKHAFMPTPTRRHLRLTQQPQAHEQGRAEDVTVSTSVNPIHVHALRRSSRRLDTSSPLTVRRSPRGGKSAVSLRRQTSKVTA